MHNYIFVIALLAIGCGAMPAADPTLDADVEHFDMPFDASVSEAHLVDAGTTPTPFRVYVENGSHEPLLGDLEPNRARMTVYGRGRGGVDLFDWNFIGGSYPCTSTRPCVETIRYAAEIPTGCTVSGAAPEVRASNTVVTRRLRHGAAIIAEQTAGGALSFAPFLVMEPVRFEYEPSTCIDPATDCLMTVYSQYLTVQCP